MDSKISGIIIDGRVYEAVQKGSYQCFDCDLYNFCKENQIMTTHICSEFSIKLKQRIMFRLSNGLTDKLKQ